MYHKCLFVYVAGIIASYIHDFYRRGNMTENMIVYIPVQYNSKYFSA